MDVLNLLSGWKRHHVAGGLVLLPPQGAIAGAIQVRQRVRPIRPLKRLLDEAAARLSPALRINVTVGGAERFVNSSGEYVALGTLSSSSDGTFFEQATAMVLADDWYAQIDGIVAEPTLATKMREAVRLLATNHYLGSGELRRRPYLYEPPPRWRGVAHPTETIYYGPRHPKQRAVMHVFHARPVKMTPAETQDRMLFCEATLFREKDDPIPAKTFTTRYGLYGEMIKEAGFDSSGHRVESYKTMLVDKRFMYLSRLDAETEEAAVALPDYLRFVERVVPVPLPPSDRHEAVIHWSD